jgi:putative DNA primase/helicase
MYKEPPLDLKHLNLFNKRVYQILSLQLPLSETSTHSNLELSPQELQLSDEAKSVWIEFYNKTEAKLNIGEELCELSDFGSKIAQIALRMAALFHYFETMTHDKPIPKAAMEAACEIARYYLKEAQRFYPSFSTSPEVSNAIKLDKWMTMFCLENATDKLSLSFISTHGPYSIRNKKVRDEALAVLEDYNRCRKVKSDNKLYVHINPKILNILKH